MTVLQIDSEGARYQMSTAELHALDGQETSLRIGGNAGVNLLIRPHVISRPIVKEVDIRMQEGEVYILPVHDRILIALTPKIALLH